MAVDIQAMLEQAAQGAEELSAETDQARETVNKVLDRAKLLSDRVELEGEEGKKALDALVAKLAEAEKQLETESEGVRTGLEGLQTKAGDVQTQVGELLTKMQSLLQDMDEEKDNLLEQMGTNHQASEENVHKLMAEIKELQESANTHLTEAEEAIDGFQKHVEVVRDTLKAQKEELEGHLEEFQKGAQEKLTELVSGFQETLTQGESKLADVTSNLENLAEKAVEHVTQQFAEEAVAQLQAAMAPLEDAFEKLDSLVGDGMEQFTSKFEEIAGTIEQITNIVEEIKPVVDLVKQFL